MKKSGERRVMGVMLTAGIIASACSKAPQETAQAPEPKAENVVTEYVESRVAALEVSKRAADRANTVIQQQERQMNNLSRQENEQNPP